MADDGYGSFSGGGSIRWKIDVNDSGTPRICPEEDADRAYTVSAVDRPKERDYKRFFLVSIDDAKSVGITVEDNTLKLSVPIRDQEHPAQITVAWAFELAKLPRKMLRLSDLLPKKK